MADVFRTNLMPLERAILQAAAYADVFDYPLTAAEMLRYLPGIPAQLEEVQAALRSGELLSPADGFYTLPGRQGLAELRCRREERAGTQWREALRYGQMLAALPYVRMLAITGSLAMDNGDADMDIDLLVVTVPGRLWTCRALILALARLAALRGVRLCPNYLVTSQALAFRDHSLYAAHELAQMVPIYGLSVYAEIRRQNAWVERILPNAAGAPPRVGHLPAVRAMAGVQRPLEQVLLGGRAGDWLEGWEGQRKIEMLTRQAAHNPEAAFGMDFCKGHLNRHAASSQQLYQRRLQELNLEATS